MFKKLNPSVLLIFMLILLASCKPSDKYTGDWYAISDSGEKVMIHISEDKTMTITNSDSTEDVFDINQTGVGIQNNVRYYHIEVDGESHYVIFENRKDEANAILLKQTNYASDFEDVAGDIIYTMNRDQHPE